MSKSSDEPFRRVEVITSLQRRRRWSMAEKVRLVEEAMQPGMSVSYVARRAGTAPIAEEGVRLIGELYTIEADIQGSCPDDRLAVRRERSAPAVARIRDWLDHHRSRVSAKAPLGQALT